MDDASYAEITKKLKSGMDLDTLGMKVTAVKFTRNGAVSMMVGVGTEGELQAEKLKAAVEAVLGPDTGVRLRSNTIRLEVHGISASNDHQEIQEEMAREGVLPPQLVIKWMRLTYDGNLMASVEVPEPAAMKLLQKGRLRVGLVYCRVKLQPKKLTRCYHCHAYGHSAARCARTSRRDCCLTCGGQKHIAKDFGALPNCVLCQDLGRSSWSHYPGSGKCEAYRRPKAEDAKRRS